MKIDMIYIIHLLRRQDRHELFNKSNPKLLSMPHRWWPAIDAKVINAPPNFPAMFCCPFSHVQCWQDSLWQNYERIIVVEDDFLEAKNFGQVEYPDTDVYRLTWYFPPHYWSAAGYVITKNGILKCLDVIKNKGLMPIDTMLTNEFHGIYSEGENRCDVWDGFSDLSPYQGYENKPALETRRVIENRA